MPKSLRNKIKHLAYKGELNERERDRILNALDREEKVCEWVDQYGEVPIFNAGGFTNTEHIGWKCSHCNGFVLRTTSYCPDCGFPMVQPPKTMCEED